MTVRMCMSCPRTALSGLCMSNHYRMSTQEWLSFQQDLFDEIVHKTKQKNQDYTAGSGDPFANFREAEDFGVEPLAGLSVRMGDKFQRVKAYLNNGELAVQNEGIRDAYIDIIGYAAIAIGMLHEMDVEHEELASMDRRLMGAVDPKYPHDGGPIQFSLSDTDPSPDDMIDESTWTTTDNIVTEDGQAYLRMKGETE